MKKIIQTLFVVFCCIGITSFNQNAIAQNYPDSPVWKALDQANAESGITGAINKLSKLKKPDEVMKASFWFQRKTITSYFDPDYTAAYAQVVRAMGLKDDASIYALIAIMTAKLDSYQCSDKSAYGVLALKYRSAFNIMLKHFNSLTESKRQEMNDRAKRMVSMRYFGAKGDTLFASKIIQNTKTPHICSYGSKAMADVLVNRESALTYAGKGEIGEKNYSVDMSSYVPKVVPLEKWEKKVRKSLGK